MKSGVEAEVTSHNELQDSKSVKATCDPLVLPRDCVNPQSQDDMGEQGDQCEVGDFEEHRPMATGVWGQLLKPNLRDGAYSSAV